MKQKLFWSIAILVFTAGAGYTFAEETKCKNPKGFYDFPNSWAIAWERKIPLKRDGIAMDALVVREYHFQDGALALYYRTDYPGYLGAEAIHIEGPAESKFVNGKLHFNFSGSHFFFRHLHTGECWREVKEFNLVANINTVEKDLEFFLYVTEFTKKKPAL